MSTDSDRNTNQNIRCKVLKVRLTLPAFQGVQLNGHGYHEDELILHNVSLHVFRVEDNVGQVWPAFLSSGGCSRWTIILNNTVPHHTTSRRTARHATPRHATPRHTTLHYTIPYHTTPHHATPHHTTPHHTTLHYTTPHYTTLHYSALQCITLHTTHQCYIDLFWEKNNKSFHSELFSFLLCPQGPSQCVCCCSVHEPAPSQTEPNHQAHHGLDQKRRRLSHAGGNSSHWNFFPSSFLFSVQLAFPRSFIPQLPQIIWYEPWPSQPLLAHLVIGGGHFRIILKWQTLGIFVFCPFLRETNWHKLREAYWLWQVATVRSINRNVGAPKELSCRM